MAAEGARAVRLALVLFEALRRLKFFSAILGVAGNVVESTVLGGVTAHVLFEVFGRKEGHLHASQEAASVNSGGASLVQLAVLPKIGQRQLKGFVASVALQAERRLPLRRLDTGDGRLWFFGVFWGRHFPS